MTIAPKRGGRRAESAAALAPELNKAPLIRPFEATPGGGLQGVSDHPRLVVALALDLVRRGNWRVGIGIGAVDRPMPTSTRDARGPAFEHARRALDAADGSAAAVLLGVTGPDPATTESARTALVLTALVVARRSAQGHAAVGLMDRGLSQAQAADVLGISKQAVSQRLTAAARGPEAAGRTLCERLLRAADV